MQEIETLICVEGDNRHTFQTWYSKHLERERKHGKSRPVQDIFAEVSGRGSIDIELVQRELVTTNEAIADADRLIGAHRLAIATGDDSKLFAPKVVDAINMQIEGLKNAKLVLETQLDAAGAEHVAAEPARGGSLLEFTSTAVGPVQSGTLREGG